MKLAGYKSALKLRWFILLTVLRRWFRCWSYYLLLCGLFYEANRFKSCLVPSCSCVFSPFCIVIISLKEERELILVLFVCLFDLRLFGLSVSSSSWCLGRAAACNCCTPWTFLLHFLHETNVKFKIPL